MQQNGDNQPITHSQPVAWIGAGVRIVNGGLAGLMAFEAALLVPHHWTEQVKQPVQVKASAVICTGRPDLHDHPDNQATRQEYVWKAYPHNASEGNTAWHLRG